MMAMKFCLRLFIASLGLVAVGCATRGGVHYSGASKVTGWKYNDPKFGAFEVYELYEQPTPPGMVFVPGGTFTMGRVAEDLPYEWNNAPRRVSIDAFYIDVTEIRNIDYREYIHWLEIVYVSYPEVVRQALPDTLAWRKPLGYNESFVEFYFRFTSYNEYPVVAVSWLQANDYCVWRTDRVNELALINAGVLDLNVLDQKDADNFNIDAYLANEYTGAVKRNLPDITGRSPEGRPVKYEDGILFPRFRLPTEAEWEYAAIASIGNTETGVLSGRDIYPWKGNRVRQQKEGPTQGQLMANFQKGRGDLMGIASNPDGNAPEPLPVTSFWPNDFGLYCMAGNVNEWVLDVYRTLSFEDVEDARPFRGNIYTTWAKDEEGRPIKDSLGRLKRDTVGYVNNRPNYLVGDNRNYRDGDMLSSINTGEEDMDKKEETVNSNKMYYQGEGEKRQGMASLVNEQSRVYKGGSFLDRVYWLSPGTRRFLDEGQSKEDIGFRCAMDRLGGANFKPKPSSSK
jgi:gliding motility-associated lipoprotein GldJ